MTKLRWIVWWESLYFLLILLLLTSGCSSPVIRAGLSVVPVVPWEGAPAARGPRRSAAKFLPRCFDVWTFSVRLNVTTTKKEKGPALRWYAAPEWLIRPCRSYVGCLPCLLSRILQHPREQWNPAACHSTCVNPFGGWLVASRLLSCVGDGGVRRHDFKYRLFSGHSLKYSHWRIKRGDGERPRPSCRLKRHQRRFLSSHYHRNVVVAGSGLLGSLQRSSASAQGPSTTVFHLQARRPSVTWA